MNFFTSSDLEQIAKNPKMQRLIKYWHQFLMSASLYDPQKKLFLAISGGRDSNFLWLLTQISKEMGLIREYSILHFNHGLRDGSEKEYEWIKKQASLWNIPFLTSQTNQLTKNMANAELEARKRRYDFFHEHVDSSGQIFLGHHIDDSFEWSLFKMMSSSQLSSRLGHSVKFDKFRRPLHCFTRDQITYWIHFFNFHFFEDEMNRDERFQRGFIRSTLIPQLKQRYPHYLKHFVWSQNELATVLGQSVFRQEAEKTKIVSRGGQRFISVEGRDLSITDLTKIRRAVHSLSGKKRGELTNQLHKLSQAFRSRKYGPLSFTGGVKAYLFPNAILLLSAREVENQLLRDKKFALNVDGIKKQDLQRSEIHNLSQLFIVSDDKWICDNLRPLKQSHPLWPEFSRTCQAKGLWFHHLWQFKRQIAEKNGQLPLSFSIMNLS